MALLATVGSHGQVQFCWQEAHGERHAANHIGGAPQRRIAVQWQPQIRPAGTRWQEERQEEVDQLKQEAPLYRAAAHSAGAFDKSSVADYTEAMLTWWRTNGGSFPAWALAARIVFASSPNSASCERVFALLRNLFGELQMKSLADYVQAALMLNYNQRNVG